VKLTTDLQLVLPGVVHPLPHFHGVLMNLVQGRLYFYRHLLRNFPLLIFRQLYNFILLYIIYSFFLLSLCSFSPSSLFFRFLFFISFSFRVVIMSSYLISPLIFCCYCYCYCYCYFYFYFYFYCCCCCYHYCYCYYYCY
jgi:hypothetical protein